VGLVEEVPKCAHFSGVYARPPCGPQSDGMRLLHPFLDANLIVMQSGLTSNCGEFAIIKIGIIDGFPDTKKLDGIAISQPIRDEKVPVFCLQHIGKGDEINIPFLNDGYCSSPNINRFAFFAIAQSPGYS
jgi:hypothetical protein